MGSVRIDTLGIVGAGAMGRGIVQIAVLAGIEARVYDTSAQAVAAVAESLSPIFDRLVEKGKLDAGAAQAALARIVPCAALEDLAGCQLVVEAIVERLDVKRDLFAKLEAIAGDDAILASNTSSLSITAIAAACKRPERVAGFHFFNPVPLMKVVEVIDGVRGDPAVGDALVELARRMGHTPVRAKDMPGFIVNHAGRGMNVEGLKTAQECVADFSAIDAIMREQAGFRMGPFELMDLTGLDVSHPVMESVYRQFFDEPRYRPSPITTLRTQGGLLGRKTGQGFYRYEDGKKIEPAAVAAPALPDGLRVWVSAAHPLGAERARALLGQLGATLDTGAAPGADSLIVLTPFGTDATTAAVAQGLDATRAVALDTLHPFAQARRRTVMSTPATLPRWRDAAAALFAADGVPVTVIQDSAGFVAQRIVATIVNIASDIAQQGIATPDDIDRAVSLGLGYPAGPLAMGDALGAATVLEILDNLTRSTGDPRYRPSPWLQRRAKLGMSLKG